MLNKEDFLKGLTSATALRNKINGNEVVERSSSLYPWTVLIVLTLANVLSFVDRKIPFILIEGIKTDLNISDTQVGLLGGLIFTAVYATMTLPLAKLSDRYSRKLIVTLAVLFWSATTALGGLAQNFFQLAATRVGLAVAEAGCTPPAHSIIADYFAPRRRALAIGIFMAGGPLGVMAGLAIGGWLADVLSWRYALILVGGAGVLLALVIFLVVQEPIRGAADASKSQHPSAEPSPGMWSTLANLLTLPSFRNLAFGAGLFAIGSTAISGFTPAYLIRSYHYSTAEAGLAIGLIAGLAGGLGSFLGGWLNSRLAPRDERWSVWIPSIGLSLALPLLLAAFSVRSSALCLFLLILPHMMALLYLGPSFALAQRLVSLRSRAMASAVLMLFIQGIGGSIGPVLAGALSDFLRPRFGVESLRMALFITSCSYGWAALHFALASRTLRRDLSNVEAKI